MTSAQIEVNQYSYFAGNQWRNAENNHVFELFEMAPKVLAGIVNVNSPAVNDEIHAPMGGVRDSGWGRTGPRSLDDFSDVIWINSHSGQSQDPF
jgi:acyl-CoA reductase-like NAD-dependent aldehyde dehydrogenase